MWCNVEAVSYIELVVVAESGSCSVLLCYVSWKIKSISQHPCEFVVAPWGALVHSLRTTGLCIRYYYHPHTTDEEAETMTVLSNWHRAINLVSSRAGEQIQAV